MKQKKSQAFNKEKYAYLLIAPGMIMVCVLLLYPLIRGILASFFTLSDTSMDFAGFAGLSFYKDITTDKIFKLALKNSFLWTVIIVISQYILGLLIALILNKDFKLRGIYRSLILIPWVVPNIAAAMTWKWMYSGQYGIINYILKSIGIIQKDIDWLGNSSIAFWAIVVTAIWKAIPFVTIVLLAGLQVIDRNQYEAADIDGAGALQSFWYITMPGIKDISITTLLLTTIWTFNQFDLIYIMTKGGPSNSTMILPVYTYMTAFNFFKFNYAATIGCIGLVIILILSFAYIKRSSKGGD